MAIYLLNWNMFVFAWLTKAIWAFEKETNKD